MTSAGTTRVTGTLTHTANTSLSAGRVLAVEGTLDMAGDGRAINGAGGAAIRVTGTFKRTGTGTNSTTAAIDNDGLVQGHRAQRRRQGRLDGRVRRRDLRSGTFELGTGAKLTGDAGISGGTVNVTGTVTSRAASPAARSAAPGRPRSPARWSGRAARWPARAPRASPRAAR